VRRRWTTTEEFSRTKASQAVFIATPSHQHRDLAIAALQAGKHVYCEAAMATDDRGCPGHRQSGPATRGQVFQPGLTLRSDPQRHFLLQFIRTGAIGKTVMARAQWHKKQSWRYASANPEREKEINWRLSKAHSLGLAGEIGCHHFET